MESSSRLPRILRLMEQAAPQKNVVILRSDTDVEDFLDSLRG